MAAEIPRAIRAVSVDEMRRIDAAAIETLGIPRLLLMEHAGAALARAAVALAATADPPHADILVCCGSGWNGGDGLAAARQLHARGHAVRVIIAASLPRLREEPGVYATILQRLGVPLRAYDEGSRDAEAEDWMSESGLLIDALLGIGAIGGTVREPIRSLILRMNASGKPILSADVPSGLNAETGQVGDVAISASQTVAFGLAKRGCVSPEGAAYTGQLTVDPISLPRQLLMGAS